MWCNLPENFGYYWIRRPGQYPGMYRLVPGKEFKNNKRSVEVWECPGIGRFRLDLQNMPRWDWQFIPRP